MEGKIDTFANRLLIAMNENKLNQVELAEKTNCCEKPISQSLINKYLKGKAFARQNNLYILAKILNVDEAWLMGYDVPMKRNTDDLLKKIGAIPLSSIKTVPIPILGTVKAGYDYMAQENWEGIIDFDKRIADTGEFFALKIKGDSMVPIFFEDDIVIFRKQNDCDSGQVAVVIINGDEGTIKKIKKTDEGIILQPFNQAYGPVMYTNKEIKETPIIIAGVFQELKRTEIKF